MTNNKINILISRPEPAGRELQQHLESQGIASHCQPFFDYQAKDTLEQLTNLQHQLAAPIIIFVSVASVEFAEKLMPIAQWPVSDVIAVGSATQQKLKTVNVSASIPEQHDSEGLLALPRLNNINTKDVIIIRGDGGRELIAETLTARGANVHD